MFMPQKGRPQRKEGTHMNMRKKDEKECWTDMY
jgi:hypothetical protein